jgi:hypothetical protein
MLTFPRLNAVPNVILEVITDVEEGHSRLIILSPRSVVAMPFRLFRPHELLFPNTGYMIGVFIYLEEGRIIILPEPSYARCRSGAPKK